MIIRIFPRTRTLTWSRQSPFRRAAKSGFATDTSGCTAPTWLRDTPTAGAVVRVVDRAGGFLARAFFSDQSQIALRVLTRHDVPVDRQFWRSRLEQALAFRSTIRIDANAYRLVHGEGDLHAVADRRSVRRLPRRPGAVAGKRSRASGDRRAARGARTSEGHPRAQ